MTRNAKADDAGTPVKPRATSRPADSRQGPAPISQQPARSEVDDARPTTEEIAETRDQLLRALAEQENIRRQARRDREEAVRFAASVLAADLLDTIDNLQRAVDSAETTAEAAVEGLLSGIQAIQRGLLDVLSRHGIQPINPIGLAFDPRYHEAVFERAETGQPEGTVIEVVQPGYLHHDRLLRPAIVGVAKGPLSPPRNVDSSN